MHAIHLQLICPLQGYVELFSTDTNVSPDCENISCGWLCGAVMIAWIKLYWRAVFSHIKKETGAISHTGSTIHLQPCNTLDPAMFMITVETVAIPSASLQHNSYLYFAHAEFFQNVLVKWHKPVLVQNSTMLYRLVH